MLSAYFTKCILFYLQVVNLKWSDTHIGMEHVLQTRVLTCSSRMYSWSLSCCRCWNFSSEMCWYVAGMGQCICVLYKVKVDLILGRGIPRRSTLPPPCLKPMSRTHSLLVVKSAVSTSCEMLDGAFKHLTYMYGKIICTVLFSSYWYELFVAHCGNGKISMLAMSNL